MGADDSTEPLYEGLGSDWNDVLSALPEDKRGEYGALIKGRMDSVVQPYSQWDKFNEAGITAQQADTAMRINQWLESNPREVYDQIGAHLGISPQQAQQVVEDEIEEQEDDDPRFKKLTSLEQQVQVMAQILMGQHNASQEDMRNAAAEKELEEEISAVQKKYAHENIPVKQLEMRMYANNMTAEEAAQDYLNDVIAIRKSRPAPFIMGQGGNIPNRAPDFTKMSSQDTRKMVADMLRHANQESNS